MPTYVIVNRQPAGYAPAPNTMMLWSDWFASLGEHLVDTGNPAFTRRTLGENTTATVLGGYTLISADDLDQAEELAADCPMLRAGGAVEIGELTGLNRAAWVTRP